MNKEEELKLIEFIKETFSRIDKIEVSVKSHKVEVVGMSKLLNDEAIMTVQLKSIIPRDQYGEPGKKYQASVKHKKKVNREWVYEDRLVDKYDMSEGDRKFIYDMYVYHHLTAEQISLLSGIPQPYIFRFIKHKKLKPNYDKIPRSKRKYDIDLSEPFELDPYPCAAEWKARREELGLKNGENWRNTPSNQNPGPKQYGSGKTSARKKLAKLNRKEERKKKNIRKFNSHQNNRYGITKDNPYGDKDPYKTYRDSLENKKKR